MAGLLGVRLPTGATVRLHAAVPLDTSLRLEESEDEASLWVDERLLASAQVSVGPDRVVAPVSSDVAARTVGPTAEQHAFPHCFVCGPSAEDGLHVTPGPVLGADGVVATTWTPDPQGSGLDVDRLAWAALDCPSGLAAMQDGRAAVLGTLSAWVDRPLVAGEPIVVVGRLLRTEGRKRFSATALYDADGEPVAWAEAIWITVD